ncbi:glycosyltransferase [Sphingomonas sp. BK069]|uniref:glycosyltransferase n=1 Tax=Sphingomonas sp. BK069 TaxID=2586979 RepID=UPI00161C4EA1|nr:glycosyltransferase [Sphingomonas sp. BK069]MBB3348995.1 peptidoglycan/xylan/chitin deacetylase (PgdA/CDA1 family)/spore germination protein YaaH/GT2 family glycosyltransferase [Sphingomonas sp. BK069]
MSIFYDASGRRGRRVRATLALAALVPLAALALLVALLVQPLDRVAPRFADDGTTPRALAPASVATRSGAWLPAATGAALKRETMGFYMPWDAPSRASLAAHLGELDWLVPGVATVTGADHRLTAEDDATLAPLLARAKHRPRLLPMVQNARADGQWDGAATAALLADAGARRSFAAELESLVAQQRGAGVMLDLESLPTAAHPDYLRFLGELRARFAPRGWAVMLAAPVADPDWDLAAYARAADRVVLMAYDEHWMGGEAGPIASQPWFARVVAQAVARAGADKAIVAIGSYAYDWAGRSTEPRSIADAWAIARRAGTAPVFDPASGNSHFSYQLGAARHDVWLLDAASAANQLAAVRRTGAAGVALWRLGSEDPGVWPLLAGRALPARQTLPAENSVAVEGKGELLRLTAAASPGERSFVARDGLVRDERWGRLPGPDVVERTGARRRLVALTFDDGPDPRWTPRLLDVLRRERASATFFVTGANALGQGPLLRRIVAEGSELGNHSTTHADLGRRSEGDIALELRATERLVEAYTGRAMTLFRPPFLGDADPDRRDELHASRVAARLGYLTVGLNVDPLDWEKPDAATIARRVIAGVAAGTADHPAQIVLLHDSGGDRTQTLAALPAIIRGLRARGYELVPVSTLAGLSRDTVMPTLAAGTGVRAAGARTLFDGAAWLRDSLGWLFVVAIALGVARSLSLTALALWRRRDAVPVAAPHRVPGFVSVLIPAFNEARVIESSVRRILASGGVRVEVIVIDDGSTDGTSDVVRAAFAIDPRVRLLTLTNGGKARALNIALAQARGDVVIALDADTQFEPDTIARLTRWFGDPAIGAVAGCAKVGNRVNLITRWQALEYVTAQQLERRALAALGAVTVVPGAVGAWRRVALDEVGGYPEDTLAEDQDLTIAVQRAGWRVACDNDAVAWTEAPETMRALFKQRFRWAFGTLQCLWKHRALIGRGRPRGLAWVGLPQALLFQFGFTLVAPLIDLGLVAGVGGTAWRVYDRGWDAAGGDAATVAAFWLAFTAIDLACGWIAFRLDGREARFPAVRLLLQRFGYRQILYAVVLRAAYAALTGPKVGWGKLERTGSVDAGAAPVAMPAGEPVPLVPEALPKAA